MTRTILPSLLLAAAIFAPAARAQQPAAPALPAWDQLTQAQRDELVAPLRDRWDANPGMRVQMQQHARRWASMSPQQRQMAGRGMQRWGRLDPDQRARMKDLFERTRGMAPQQRRETMVLFRAMRDMTPEQREALRQRWNAMSADQRRAWMRDNAPPPHRPGRFGPPPPPEDD